MEKEQSRVAKDIETMFRISSGNHQRLSEMADNKAHILITVNSIILSAVISILLRKTAGQPWLLIPSWCLLLVSLATMVFAIRSTRPSIAKGLFTQQSIQQKSVNLLFFGNFYRMSLKEYSNGMTRMLEDADFMFNSLIQDLYAQGVVIGRKYRLLRMAYNIFMFGMIVSVLLFFIMSIISQ